MTFGPRLGSGPFAPGSIRAQRLRFASLHLLSIAEACESLSSAKVMAGNIANSIGGPQGNPLLALQQLIMLNELLVNRLLDKLRLPQ
ncbi:DUF6124 family protein [Pseudomonas putida]|uniref:DUF6124 family protein n=1 Tax=Pseudomonas putida TaxID=303 RepID=UPI003FD509DD